jgi:uncharacterized protein YuzE
MKNDFKITYDKEADAMYMHLKNGKVKNTKEVSNLVFVDVDSKNNPLGIEILNVSYRFEKTKKENSKNTLNSIPV